MEFDVFISHASENKSEVALPLANLLREHGVKVWLDVFELKLGDSLSQSIDKGLAQSKFGIVILSPEFFRKHWTQRELGGLVARESGTDKVILPIWHNITHDEIAKYSPTLADKIGVPTVHGLQYVAQQVLEAIGEIPFKPTNTTPTHQASPTIGTFKRIVRGGVKWSAKGLLIGPVTLLLYGLSVGTYEIDTRNFFRAIINGMWLGLIICPIVYFVIIGMRKLIK